MERHGRRIHYIKDRIEELKNQRKLPWQWFRKRPIEKLAQYEKTLALERRAQALLENYEKELKNM